MTEEKNNNKIFWLKKKKRILIGLGTVVLVLIMFIIVDFPNLLLKISKIGFWGIFFFIITYTLAFIFRASKLKFIFKGIDQRIKYQTSFFSIGICFGINDLLPGKLGELAKIVSIKDQEHLQLSDSVCAVTIERVLDLIILFFITICALIYLYIGNFYDNESISIFGRNLQYYLAIGTIIIVILIFILFVLIYRTQFILNIINRLSHKISNLLGTFIINFKEGMKKFRYHKKEFVYTLFLGFITWMFDAFIIVIFFYFLGYRLNTIILILAVIILFFSKTFTITPGGWGISENIGALFIFLFYPQIPFIEILAVFIIDHLFRSAFLFFYGGYSILHYNFNLEEAQKTMI